MVQPATKSLQSPVTPARQLGAARGPRRTPASRTKKPYSRPATAETQAAFKENCEAQASPSFLKGMRSLVSRLWGTSIKSTPGAPGLESPDEKGPPSGMAEKVEIQSQPDSAPAAASAPANPSKATGAFDRTPDMGRYSATVAERRSSHRVAAPEAFVLSPFAYNKKLAAASPSVANLRDVARVKNHSPSLSRRHSISRIDVRNSTRSDAHYAGGNGNSGGTGEDSPSQCVSPSNARRLLSTLNSINTPILDARSRLTGGQPLTAGLPLGHSPATPSAGSSGHASLVPLRRLPVSLLALGDLPEKARRSPLATANDILDKETLRRANSLKGASRRQSAAPSLARTIQLQQARKAVAERLSRSRSMAAAEHDADREQLNAGTPSHELSQSDSQEVHRAEGAASGAVPKTGERHAREEDSDRSLNKRRKAADGEAVEVLETERVSASQEAHKRKRINRLKRTRSHRLGRAARLASTIDTNIKWRFSARLDPASDSEMDASDESDEDRDALSAKVPLSKIRGGELIGLSLRPTASPVSAASNNAGPIPIRSTGFGSNRTPIPIVSELETLAPTTPAMPAISSTSVAAAAATTTSTAPTVSSFTLPVATSIPEPTTASQKPAPGSTSLFGSFASKPLSEPSGKTEPEATASKPAAQPAASTPVFKFGVSAPADDATKPDTPRPMFQFGATAASSAETSSSAAADSEKPKPAFSFGFKPTGTSTETSGDKSETAAAPKPADSLFATLGQQPSAAETATGTGAASTTAKRALDDQEPATTAAAPSKPAFSFGASTAASKDSTSAAAPATTFGAGLFGASTSSSADSTTKPAAETGSKSAAPSGFAPSTGFSFGKTATDASTSASGSGFTFGSSASTSALAPAKTIDLTTSTAPTSADSTSAAAAASAPLTFTATKAPTFGSFSGFGKSTTADSAAVEDKPSATTASSSAAPIAAPAFGGFGASSGLGATSTAASTAAPATSIFGKAPTAATSDSAAPKPAFTFGAGAAAAASTTTTTTTAPAFGAPASSTTTPTTPSFQFGSSDSKPAAGSGFGSSTGVKFGSFGSQSSEDKPASGFTFGSGSVPSSVATAAPATNNASGTGGTFTFGSGAATTTSNASAGFGSLGSGGGASFGSNTAVPPSTGFGSTATVGGAFGSGSNSTPFGAANNSSSASAPAFGSGFGGSADNKPAFSFGQSSVSTSSTGAQFGSGGASSGFGGGAATQGAGSFGFSFGSNSAQQGSGTSQPGQFQFTAGSMQPAAGGPGAFSMGRTASGSNLSTSSRGRAIAQPRTRLRR
ncbi:hypothetical protein GQ54DRAFT_152390 [Martensiomyces pterosporus]|nr:hypothetical protein GQ54DRAFT_152390 [Martensiomyces pterosporus]